MQVNRLGNTFFAEVTGVDAVDRSLARAARLAVLEHSHRQHERVEAFELRLDADATGRMLVVRATDALNNVAAGQVQIPSGK